MVNSQLSDYIKQQLQQGKSEDVIRGELINTGWQEADINQAFGIPGSSQPPRPPATPSFTATGLQQLDSKAVWLFFLRSIFGFLFIALWIGLSFMGSLGALQTISGVLGVGLVILLCAVILSFIWAKITYHFYRYELKEEGFRKESGVIIKRYVTIPYDRIQNVDIYRGILDRILGLSALKIQTAGNSKVGAEGILPGTSSEDAEKLRDELVSRARRTNQGL